MEGSDSRCAAGVVQGLSPRIRGEPTVGSTVWAGLLSLAQIRQHGGCLRGILRGDGPRSSIQLPNPYGRRARNNAQRQKQRPSNAHDQEEQTHRAPDSRW